MGGRGEDGEKTYGGGVKRKARVKVKEKDTAGGGF